MKLTRTHKQSLLTLSIIIGTLMLFNAVPAFAQLIGEDLPVALEQSPSNTVTIIRTLINYVLGLLALLATIPTILLLPALIITGIIGHKTKNYRYMKIYLIVWAVSVVAVPTILVLAAITNFALQSSTLPPVEMNTSDMEQVQL